MERSRFPRLPKRKRARLATFGLFFLLLGIAGVAYAQERDRCHIPEERHIAGNFIAFCERLQLDGRVDGVLIVAAVEAEIRGTVGGDAYILATRLELRGDLAKDLHFAGGVLEIHEEAQLRDESAAVLAATLHSRLRPAARLPGDYLGVGYQLLLEGTVGGAVEYSGSQLFISGSVAEDVRATVGDATTTGISQLQPLVNLFPLPLDVELLPPGLTLAEGARVGGDLRYRAPRPAELHGTVDGRIVHDPATVSVTSVVRPGDWQRYWRNALREFVVLGVIATGVWWLAGRPLHDSLRHISQRPLTSFGVGLLTFILSFPIALLVALASGLLLLPLNWLGSDLLLYGAMLVGMVDFGLASLFYFGAIFLSRVVAAVALGRWLHRRSAGARHTAPVPAANAQRGNNGNYLSGGTGYLTVLMGCAVLALLSSLPYAGWVLNAFAAFLGLGAIVSSTRQRLRVLRLPPPPPSRYETTNAIPGQGEAPPPPPPIPAESWRRQPGMANLPPGFRWWEESEDPAPGSDGDAGG